MVRITTNSSLFMYKSGLMKSTTSVNNAMQKLMTYRNFDSYAQDPAAATRAFKVHSSLNATDTQASNTETLISKYDTAWSNMEAVIDDLTKTMGLAPALTGLNGTNWGVLDSQAQVLEQGAESIVLAMNAKYNEDFIFAGADTQEAPFTIVEEANAAGEMQKYVAFRGVKVDHDLGATYTDENGNTLANPATGADYTNAEILDKWNEEGLFVDIGLGFELDAAGNVIETTAFNAAISGIEFLGYGLDADGDPQNTASIMLRIAEIFEEYDSGSADPWNGREEEVNRLTIKLDDAHSNMVDEHAELSARSLSLSTNLSQLESRYDSLNIERAGIEDIDMADAIEQFMWAQTAYNAALQVGRDVIPQSLMDYMN